MTKTFKLGEWAIGGIIRVQKQKDVIQIQSLDWITKQPILEEKFHIERSGYLNQIDDFLHQLTSHYYADKVMSYIKNIVPNK